MRRALALLLLAAPALAATPAAVTVQITSPPPGQSVFGVIQVSAMVRADEQTAEVSFAVDGRIIARLHRAPYQASTDVGPDNVEHRIEVVATTVSGATGRAELVTPRIQVDQEMVVELRQLYITIRQDGADVLDLRPEEFRIVDDGHEQRIVTFARGDIPFTAMLLLDSSSSMRGEPLEAAVEGARTFAKAMRPLDEGKLMVFSDRLLHTTPVTGAGGVLLAGLESVRAQGGTAVNDNLFLALTLLEARQGRRVVVVLSDGTDTNSALAMTDVIRKVRESRALVYWLRLEPDVPLTVRDALVSPWHDGAWYRRQLSLLEEAADSTGGRVVPIHRTEEIAPAFAEIVHELREQYVIGYYPSGLRHDGRWRKVAVKVARRGPGQLTPGAHQVQTRDGYVDD